MLHQDVIRARKKKKFILGISLDIKAEYNSIYMDELIMKSAQLGISVTECCCICTGSSLVGLVKFFGEGCCRRDALWQRSATK